MKKKYAKWECEILNIIDISFPKVFMVGTWMSENRWRFTTGGWIHDDDSGWLTSEPYKSTSYKLMCPCLWLAIHLSYMGWFLHTDFAVRCFIQCSMIYDVCQLLHSYYSFWTELKTATN